MENGTVHIRLYHHPKTRSARILWLAHELAPNMTVEVARMNLYAGDQYDEPISADSP